MAYDATLTVTLEALHARAADIIGAQTRAGQQFQSMETIRMADGSGRFAVLIHFIADDHDWTHRITAPAPATAPAWAAIYRDFVSERVTPSGATL